jgi:hypothetical protein
MSRRTYFCLVIRGPHHRVIHWHWPRADIVNCENSKQEVSDE